MHGLVGQLTFETMTTMKSFSLNLSDSTVAASLRILPGISS